MFKLELLMIKGEIRKTYRFAESRVIPRSNAANIMTRPLIHIVDKMTCQRSGYSVIPLDTLYLDMNCLVDDMMALADDRQVSIATG